MPPQWLSLETCNEQFPATCPWIPNFLLPTDFQPSDSKFNLESGPFYPSCHVILQHVAFNNPTAQNLHKTPVSHVRSKIRSIESHSVPLSNLKISNLKSQYPTFFSFFIFVFLLKQRLPHLKAKPQSPFKEAKRKNNSTPFSTPRNSENSSAMRGQSNGGARGFASPDRGGGAGAHDKRGTRNNNNNNHHSNNNNDYNKSGASSETAHDSKKGGSSSASGEAVAPPVVWPPKFAIALTNKEKEEDFLAIKGSKLPQRPKKRAKLIQRTVNLVSPGAWLCDLTLERYEVREKKITKKRPRGLKAMGNMESESE